MTPTESISVALVLAGLFVFQFLLRRNPSPTLGAKRELELLRIGRAEILVEVADTFAKKYRGLSGRPELLENQGMLFTYSRAGRYSFCMRGMLIPLDFVWLRGGRVVEILPDVRPEDYPPLKRITPQEKFDAVLEVNAGTTARLEIAVGDAVVF